MRHLKLLGMVLFTLLLPQHAESETLTYTYDVAGRLTNTALNYGVDITYTYDATGNRLERLVVIDDPIAGDVNNDGSVTLEDAILSLQITSGITLKSPIFKESDINNNNRIDLAETIWGLRTIAEM